MQELIESGQFLTLSRRNSALFERSHQFTLANGTLVDITAPGIISFSVLLLYMYNYRNLSCIFKR